MNGIPRVASGFVIAAVKRIFLATLTIIIIAKMVKSLNAILAYIFSRKNKSYTLDKQIFNINTPILSDITRDNLRRYIEGMQGDSRDELGSGIMIQGERASGKRFLAKCIAGEINKKVFEFEAAEIFSGDFKIQKLYDFLKRLTEANKDPKGAVIILDKIDSLGNRDLRINTSQDLKDLMTTLLAKMLKRLLNATKFYGDIGDRQVHDIMDSPYVEEAFEHSNTSAIAISTMLEQLDGLESNRNITFILISENEEELDDALIRPGRITFSIDTSQEIRSNHEKTVETLLTKHNFINLEKSATIQTLKKFQMFSYRSIDVLLSSLGGSKDGDNGQFAEKDFNEFICRFCGIVPDSNVDEDIEILN